MCSCRFFFIIAVLWRSPWGDLGSSILSPSSFLKILFRLYAYCIRFPPTFNKKFSRYMWFSFSQASYSECSDNISKVTSWKLLSIGTASEKLHFSRLLTAVTWFLYLFVLLGSNPVAVSHLPTSCRASLGTHRQGALWKKIRESTSLHLYFWSLESQAMISSPCEGRSI